MTRRDGLSRLSWLPPNGWPETRWRPRTRCGLFVGAGFLIAQCGGPTTPTVYPDLTDPRRAAIGGDVDGPLDQKDFVEALFLGSGPLSDPNSTGCAFGRGVMGGWPVPTYIKVRISSGLSTAEREGAIGPVAQVAAATDNRLTAAVEMTEEQDPLPLPREITAARRPNLAEIGCRPPATGCAIVTGSFFEYEAVRIVSLGPALGEDPGRGFSHEMGHALYGFCHVDPNSRAAAHSIMAKAADTHRLTDDDIRALQAVYRAGLRPGAKRAQFVAAGLIRP